MRYSESGEVSVYVSNPNTGIPDLTHVNPYVALARLSRMAFAYHGKYAVDGVAMVLTHRVLGAMDATQIGATRVWQMRFGGDDRLVLTATLDSLPVMDVEVNGTNVLTWERGS